MNLLEFLTEDNVFIDFEAKNQKDFFEKAVTVIVEKYSRFKYKEVLKLFLAREKTMTTGIGKKIAIPHIMYDKCPAQQLFVFNLHNPIDFKSLDKQPVELVIMFIGPKEASNLPYLQMLAKFSRLMKNDATVEKLVTSKSIEAIYDALKEYEQR